MNRKPDVETILAETQAPRLVESDHRQRLKNQLIQERRKESPIMIRWMTVHRKTAWALGLFLTTVVATSSWAGYKIMRSYMVEVKTVHEINVIDKNTGEITDTAQVETAERVSIEIPESAAAPVEEATAKNE